MAGLGGGLLFRRLKVPGGMMVGSIVLVAALSICTGGALMPRAAKTAAQSLAGAFIACGMEKNCYLPLDERAACFNSYDGGGGDQFYILL